MTTETNFLNLQESSPSINDYTEQSLSVNTDDIFQWTKQWYPIAVVDFLDPSHPNKVQLLGQDLVLWKDGTGQWRCFEDACPHRLAPLSEGRVEADGTLLCAYHAWRFEGTGKCVRIPQAKDAATESQICANVKACAKVYPTQEQQGLLWVWGESGSDALIESQSRQPRTISELETNSDQVVKLFWNIRDLPYGWDFFMENVADPAHVPVSHHGLVGNRYRDAQYYDMPRIREISTQEGFAFGVTTTNPTIINAVHDFQPPCLMKISSTFTDGGQLILALYATPTRPGWCRHIGCQILVKNNEGRTPKGLAFFALPMPTWLGHVLASLFLHQDLVFLHYQEKTLLMQQPEKWLDAVYTPNPQDKMVITLRQWLLKRAGGGVPWFGGSNLMYPPPQQDKRQLFDVWTTHTQHCTVCQKAVSRIERLKVLSYVGAMLLLLVALMVDARALSVQAVLMRAGESFLGIWPPVLFWVFLGLAATFGTTGYLLQRFSRLFYVYEFDHAQNH
ncbi:Rieske 2Fe-2S domain-containing protein [Aphanothece hegewaldii]|uniref:aromatic ring-hydroxylating dioxygenase subunit alpha n=1 Tax=Aphanothece hegewaldii TaxID=1521625 RepID=UPI001FE98F16|nr:Rieske 2Fe-2S domain-containing protein [Aphanothece hegewaldii]